MRLKLLFLSFGCLLFLNQVSSQVIRRVSNFRYFEFKDGLPENNIREFIVDNENGYWFRASSNIIYFNGYEFTNYNISGKTFTLSNEEIFSFNLYKSNIYVFGNSGIDVINCKTKESHLIFKYPNPLQTRAGFITWKFQPNRPHLTGVNRPRFCGAN